MKEYENFGGPKRVDWDAVERECSELSTDMPDCIPTNAREWSIVKTQHDRLCELWSMVSAGTFGTAIIPTFSWKYIRRSDQYKRSLEEIAEDILRIPDSNVADIWKRNVGDVWHMIKSCVLEYARKEENPLFKINEANYRIDRSALIKSVEEFNKIKIKYDVASSMERSTSDWVNPLIPFGDLVLMEVLGSDLFERTDVPSDYDHYVLGYKDPTIVSVVNLGYGMRRSVIPSVHPQKVRGPRELNTIGVVTVVGAVTVGKLPDVIKLLKRNPHVFEYLHDVLSDDLPDKYDAMVNEISYLQSRFNLNAKSFELIIGRDARN